MTAVRINPTEGQMHVGDYYEAAWTASSSSSNLTVLTNSITLPAGTYIVQGKLPVISNASFFAYIKSTDGTVDVGLGVLANQCSAVAIITIPAQKTLRLVSAQSAACTFSYLERGFIRAVRLA